MHFVTFDFIASTDDLEQVIAAHQPVIDAFMAHEACLGVQLLKSKRRKEPRRYLLHIAWRSPEEALAVSSLPDVREAHDKIFAAQSSDQTMSVWGDVVQAGLFTGAGVTDRLAVPTA